MRTFYIYTKQYLKYTPNNNISATELLNHYNSINPTISQTQLGIYMSQLNYQKKRFSNGVYYLNISINSSPIPIPDTPKSSINNNFFGYDI